MKQSKARRPLALAALVVSLLGLTLSMTGVADAVRKRAFPGPSTKPKAYGLLRLGKNKKFTAKALPKVRSARSADRLAGKRLRDLQTACPPSPPDTTDFGTWCLMDAPYVLTPGEVGKNDYFFATQKCVHLGGYLPTAEMLTGAAPRAQLSSTIDDSEQGALIDVNPADGLKDRREMSATLITTAAGSSSAGSQGVTEGSRGDPRQGESDPVPSPADPTPDTLQYVTVYDNHDKGGFAGAKPVTQTETFRCAFGKAQRGRVERIG